MKVEADAAHPRRRGRAGTPACELGRELMLAPSARVAPALRPGVTASGRPSSRPGEPATASTRLRAPGLASRTALGRKPRGAQGARPGRACVAPAVFPRLRYRSARPRRSASPSTRRSERGLALPGPANRALRLHRRLRSPAGRSCPRSARARWLAGAADDSRTRVSRPWPPGAPRLACGSCRTRRARLTARAVPRLARRSRDHARPVGARDAPPWPREAHRRASPWSEHAGGESATPRPSSAALPRRSSSRSCSSLSRSSSGRSRPGGAPSAAPVLERLVPGVFPVGVAGATAAPRRRARRSAPEAPWQRACQRFIGRAGSAGDEMPGAARAGPETNGRTRSATSTA